MLNDNEKEMYERWGKNPSTHDPHGTDEDIKENLKPIRPTKWRQEGNKLIGDTEMGRVVQFVPTDMMLQGTDEKGLPILKKVVL